MSNVTNVKAKRFTDGTAADTAAVAALQTLGGAGNFTLAGGATGFAGNNMGQKITGGFGAGKSQYGVQTDKKIKRIGCQNLKTLIDNGKLQIYDGDIISEISTFIESKGSYAADDGYHDDLVMCLVLFGWLTSDQYFTEMNDVNLREEMYKNQMKQIEEELTPFGFINDGHKHDDEEELINF